MRAIVCTDWGAPLALAEIAEPVPGPDEVAIDVHACSVNFADLLMIAGRYQTRPELPFVPGLEAAGTIASAPPGSPFAVGDRVIALLWHGGYAERAVASARETFALPAGISFETAAALASAYTSADLALREVGRLAASETVLVSGASGGVGLAAVQIARAVGANVIAVVSAPSRAEPARLAGARVICDLAELRDETVDLVLDPVGGPFFDRALSALDWGGRYVVVGFASGTVPQVPADRVLLKHRSIHGCSLRYFRRFAPEPMRRSVAQLFAWYAEGKLAPLVSARFPLEHTALALEQLSSRRALGKVVVTVRNPP